MADLSTKKDPLHLPDERPDYVEDKSGVRDPDEQPDAATDPMSLPTEGPHKPAVPLDEEKVRKAEREGKGY